MKFLITILITFGITAVSASAQAPVLPGDDISVDEGAYITQINNNNDAEIDQSGTHSGEIYQVGITGDGNYARLNQGEIITLDLSVRLEIIIRVLLI